MLIHVENLDDPRLVLYRNLKDRDLARRGGRFIAEGEHLVHRLIDSRYAVESMLVSDKKLDRLVGRVPDSVPIFVAGERELGRIVGFKFHTGAIAVALRGPSPALADLPLARDLVSPCRVLVCPDLNNGANLGGLIRTAAGLGLDAVLVGPGSIDPFCRYSVRVSMGAIFRIPMLWSDDLHRDLLSLRDHCRLSLIATVCEGGSDLARFAWPRRSALLVGCEAQGLDQQTRSICDHRLTIAMRHQTDSLNVTIAGAIAMWEMSR